MADEKRLERIEAKLDDMNECLGSINVTIGQYNVILKEHTRRSTMLEDQVRPIRKHVDMVEGAFKLITILAASIGAFEAARVLFHV